MDDKTLARIRKIKALADRGGTHGERVAAQSLLDELLQKYEVDLEEIDLTSEEVEDFDFYFHGKDEKKILIQVMYKVTDVGTYYELSNAETGRRRKTKIRKKCTKSQKIEIEILFEFYTRLWYKEKDFFMTAFIDKHDLYGVPPEDAEIPERSLEDSIKIHMLQRGMSDEKPLKMIESGEGK